MFALSTRRERHAEIVAFLAQRGAGLELSVPLIARLSGSRLEDVIQVAGCSRQLLYFALRGERTPSAALRGAMLEVLDIDPWAVLETMNQAGRDA